METVDILFGAGIFFCGLACVYYFSATIRESALMLRAGIDAQAAAIDRYTSFAQREAERERRAQMQTPQSLAHAAFTQERLVQEQGKETEHGFRNTQRRT